MNEPISTIEFKIIPNQSTERIDAMVTIVNDMLTVSAITSSVSVQPPI
jgi:hypothetical protein